MNNREILNKYKELGFSRNQLRVIEDGLDYNVDISKFADKNNSPRLMELICRGLVDGIDITEHLNEGYTLDQLEFMVDNYGYVKHHPVNKDYWLWQLEALCTGYLNGIDVEPYIKEGFNKQQIGWIVQGIEDNIDYKKYAKLKYSEHIMEEMYFGLMDNIDLTEYAEQGYSDTTLKYIRLAIKNNLEVSKLLDKSYTSAEVEQLYYGLTDGIDLTPYINDFYSVEEVDLIRRCLIENVDMLDYIIYNQYNLEELEEIYKYKKEGYDITPYIDDTIPLKNIKWIIKGLNLGVDISDYAFFCHTDAEFEVELEKLQKQRKVM